ncbi:ABC transporter permease [Primorskyibacter flagellatus]|uniref:ABC transporter permease n=1 Tax=Primorskyibacter flagellatus TaxID=1387277 RepID=UPI00166D5D6B|nr:ABC transporter permease [Primorskyibacter flagellatus]
MRTASFQLLPGLAILAGLFLLPLSYFFVVSFWQVRTFRLRPDATLEQYARVFTEYGSTLAWTLAIATLIATVTAAIAFAYAHYCRFRAGRFGDGLIFLSLVTLFGGYLAKIYMWKTILGGTGALNSALMALGLTSGPIPALLFSPFAVIVTLTHYCLPLAILPVYGALRGLDDTAIEAARDLGASGPRIFRDLILAQARGGLTAAFALTLVITAADYVTPLMVGGPSSNMIGLFIQSQFGNRLNSPLGSAMAFVTIACCGLIVLTLSLTLRALTRPRT